MDGLGVDVKKPPQGRLVGLFDVGVCVVECLNVDTYSSAAGRIEYRFDARVALAARATFN
jgi:hypothetical protein